MKKLLSILLIATTVFTSAPVTAYADVMDTEIIMGETDIYDESMSTIVDKDAELDGSMTEDAEEDVTLDVAVEDPENAGITSEMLESFGADTVDAAIEAIEEYGSEEQVAELEELLDTDSLDIDMSDATVTDVEIAEDGSVIVGVAYENIIPGICLDDETVDTNDCVSLEEILESDDGNNITLDSVYASNYDLRNENIVTSVKNQGDYGSCWTFAALSAIETSLIKNGYASKVYSKSYDPIDLSELNLAYSAYVVAPNDKLGNMGKAGTYNPSDMYNFLDKGGNEGYVTNAIARGDGLLYESDVPYSLANRYIQNYKKQGYDTEYKLNNKYNYQLNAYVRVEYEETDAVKAAILKYGVGSTSCKANNYVETIIGKNSVMTCYSSSGLPNHAVAVVGWDDSVSRFKFKDINGKNPSRDGAFIIKNSWGSKWGGNGYFYMSYEDKSASYLSVHFFDVVVDKKDTELFQYNGNCSLSYSQTSQSDAAYSVRYFNETEKDVYQINRTSIAKPEQAADAEVRIYKNIDDDKFKNMNVLDWGEPASVKSFTFDSQSTFTVTELDTPVKVAPGENFVVSYFIKRNSTVGAYAPLQGPFYGLHLSYCSVDEETKTGVVSRSYMSQTNTLTELLDDNNMPIRAYASVTQAESISDATITYVGTPNAGNTIEYNDAKYLYENTKHIGKITVKSKKGDALEEGVDYALTDSQSNPYALGTHTLTFKGIGAYVGSKTINVEVTKNSLSDATVLYGKAITTADKSVTPTTVTWHGDYNESVELSADDYSVTESCENRISGATVNVTIEGKRNYKDSCKTSYTLDSAVLSSAKVTINDPNETKSQDYRPGEDISKQIPNEVYINGEKAVLGKDYEARITALYNYVMSKYVKVFVLITALPDSGYTGSVELQYNIRHLNLENATMLFKNASVSYAPNTEAKGTNALSVIYNNTSLTEGTDYNLSYSGNGIDKKGNLAVGEITVTATGLKYCYGSISNHYTVKPKPISINSSVENYFVVVVYYPGMEPLPPVVTNDGLTLIEDVDYDVTYSGKRDGKAFDVDKNSLKAYDRITATITGKGNYNGSFTKSYIIQTLDLIDTEVFYEDEVEYTEGMGLQKPVITYHNAVLTEGVDYELAVYKDEEHEIPYTGAFQKGDVYVVVGNVVSENTEGANAYKYRITGPNLKNAEVTFAHDTVEWDPEMKKQVPTVVKDGKTLTNGVDFETKGFEDYNKVNAVEGKITERIGGDYSGSKEVSYEVVERNLSTKETVSSATETRPVIKSEISYTEKTYSIKNTAKPSVTLTHNYINENVQMASVNLNEGTDYAVSDDMKTDENGVLQAGTYKVTATGEGNYGEKRDFEVIINPKNITDADVVYTNEPINNQKIVYSPVLTPILPTLSYENVGLKLNEDYGIKVNGGAPDFYTPSAGVSVNIALSGRGNYTGDKTYTYQVVAKKFTNADLGNSLIITMPENLVYSMSLKDIVPESVSYKYGEGVNDIVKLEKGTDYVITPVLDEYGAIRYKAGENTLKITFKGNYSGSVTKTYEIAPNPINKDSENFKIELKLNFSDGDVTMNYPGTTPAKQYAVNEVKDDDSWLLTEGTDYIITMTGDGLTEDGKSLKLNYNAETGEKSGSVTVKLQGINNYAGEEILVETYNVLPIVLADGEGKVSENLTIEGIKDITVREAKALGNSIQLPTVKYGDDILRLGEDYTVSISDETLTDDDAIYEYLTSVGEKKLTISMTESSVFTGSITYTYKVNANPTDNLHIEWANAVPHEFRYNKYDFDSIEAYDGYDKAQTRLTGGTGVSYDFSSSVTVENPGVRNGSVQVGSTVKATVIFSKDFALKNGDNYTLTKSYKVDQQDLTTETVDGKKASITGLPTEAVRRKDAPDFDTMAEKIVVTDKYGHVLTKGTDYEVTLPEGEYNARGEKVFTVKGVNNYKGELTASYMVKGTDPIEKKSDVEYDITLVKGGNAILDELKGATLVKYVLPDGTSTTRSNKYATFTARTGTVKALQAVNDFSIIAKKDGEEYVLNVKVTAPYFALNDTEKYTVANKNAYVSMDYGTTANLGFTGTDLDISYTSENSDYLTVDRNGNVATTDIVAPPGTRVKITAMANGVKYTMPVVINVPKFTAKSYIVNAKNTENHNDALSDVNEIADAMNEAGYDVTYTSSAPSVADVDADGKITGLSVGNATITARVVARVKTSAKSVQPATYKDKTYTYTARVTVYDPQIATNIKGTTYDAATGVLSISEDTQTSLNVVSINATGKRTVTTTLLGTWTTENDNIAHLNTSKNKWTVTGQKPDGSTVIRANVNGRVLEQTVKVLPKYNPAIRLSDAYKMSARTTTINLSSAVSNGAKFSQWEVVEGGDIASITTIRGKQYLSLNPNMTGTIKVRLTNFSAHMQNKRIVEKSIVISKHLGSNAKFTAVICNGATHELESVVIDGEKYTSSQFEELFNITYVDKPVTIRRVSKTQRTFTIESKNPFEFNGSGTFSTTF